MGCCSKKYVKDKLVTGNNGKGTDLLGKIEGHNKWMGKGGMEEV